MVPIALYLFSILVVFAWGYYIGHLDVRNQLKDDPGSRYDSYKPKPEADQSRQDGSPRPPIERPRQTQDHQGT